MSCRDSGSPLMLRFRNANKHVEYSDFSFIDRLASKQRQSSTCNFNRTPAQDLVEAGTCVLGAQIMVIKSATRKSTLTTVEAQKFLTSCIPFVSRIVRSNCILCTYPNVLIHPPILMTIHAPCIMHRTHSSHLPPVPAF